MMSQESKSYQNAYKICKTVQNRQMMIEMDKNKGCALQFNVSYYENYELSLTDADFASREDLRNYFQNLQEVFDYLHQNPDKLLTNEKGEVIFSIEIGGAKKKIKQLVLQTKKRQKEYKQQKYESKEENQMSGKKVQALANQRKENLSEKKEDIEQNARQISPIQIEQIMKENEDLKAQLIQLNKKLQKKPISLAESKYQMSIKVLAKEKELTNKLTLQLAELRHTATRGKKCYHQQTQTINQLQTVQAQTTSPY